MASIFHLSSSSPRHSYELPSEFKFLNVLGAGGFGEVVKCLKKDTNQTVAVKIPKFLVTYSTEVPMMERLMRLKLDEKNIIKFFGWFNTSFGKALVFESLDISLEEYIIRKGSKPMLLTDIRTIIQQLATALDALKTNGLMHTDLKPDNIMMVDHRKRPFMVKLIDFGLAKHWTKAKQGSTEQVIYYRAPEIILGLRFDEAIDMWALGCVMGMMLLGGELFLGTNEYDALQDIIALLGMPADHLLKNGQRTHKYFTRTECNSWRLQTHQEYWMTCPRKPHETKLIYSLDDLRNLRLEKNNKSEALERSDCIDLLEAMLNLDAEERITPIGAKYHPFIRGGNMTLDNYKRFKLAIKKQSAHAGPSQDSTEVPTGVTMVRPAAAIKKVEMWSEEDTSDKSPAEVALNKKSAAQPGVIMVQPASDENTTSLEEEESQDSDESPAEVALNKKSAAQPGVIMVQPASDENTTSLEEEESQDSDESPAEVALNKKSAAQPGVIMVQPASDESTTSLEEEESQDSLQAETIKTSSEAPRDGEALAKTSGDKKAKKEKKKKNIVRRAFSWMRKAFRSCCAAVKQDKEGDK